MRIAAEQRHSGGPLLHALIRALEALGASVTIDPAGENLIRRVGAKREFEIPPEGGPYRGPVCAHVLAQGLPNLLHEFGHVIQRRCIDDDHGIDYQAIPFDLRSVGGRAMLFEELACCVLSCSFVAWDDVAADAWFEEQVGIQPVFYGLEDDPPRFWREVDRCVREHGSEADTVVAAAFDAAATLLRWSGAPATLAAPSRRRSLPAMLGRRSA